MKKLFKVIVISINLILTLICAASLYELLEWTTENNTELPKSVQIAPQRNTFIRKPDKFDETVIPHNRTVPQTNSGISGSNNPEAGIEMELNHNGSLNDYSEFESNKYPLNLTGGKNSVPGFVIVDDTGTVYTKLDDIVSALGWTLLNDGSVFSDKQLRKKIMKLELNKLPSSTIVFNGRGVRLDHPVVDANGSVVVPLSDLRDLWILDFSIDPVSKNLNLSYSPQ